MLTSEQYETLRVWYEEEERRQRAQSCHDRAQKYERETAAALSTAEKSERIARAALEATLRV